MFDWWIHFGLVSDRSFSDLAKREERRQLVDILQGLLGWKISIISRLGQAIQYGRSVHIGSAFMLFDCICRMAKLSEDHKDSFLSNWCSFVPAVHASVGMWRCTTVSLAL